MLAGWLVARKGVVRSGDREAVVGGGRHEDGAAGNDVGDDFGSIVGGENDVGSFGVVGDHAGHFCAGAQADHAADGSVGVAEWIMPFVKTRKL